MEIIYHTAELAKNEVALQSLLGNSDVDAVELDFILSSDAQLFWTHDWFNQMRPSSFFQKKGFLSLTDVLEINYHRQKLSLDIKYVPKSVLNSSAFMKTLRMLDDYDEMQIASLDVNFLHLLSSSEFDNFETGMIINVLTKRLLKNPKIFSVASPHFLSISSELWERNDGDYIKCCQALYPACKKYAWTWSKHPETPARIENFIARGADGILTSDKEIIANLRKKSS